MAEIVTDFIPCMLIPLEQHYLLLPNTTIAEVIPMPRYAPVDDKPKYWLGQYAWNGQTLTIIDLERLVEGEHDREALIANKLCIIHSINPDSSIQAYGLPCHGAPQLIHLNESALKLVEGEQAQSPYLHCQTHIGNKIAYIPDLDKIETLITE